MEQLNYMEIGIRIRNLRELLGYSREKMAEYLGVSTKFCSDIELGVKGMSIQTLSKLSSLLHVSTDYILFGEKESGEYGNIIELYKNCPPDKISYAEEILKIFLKSLN